ncbi:hypothetical protein PISMIDRAFT_676243 [Pisolithus microcarpus 441]|uniref:tryptophan synthase n=1 Tax=Pisolithus microcarpus 441 TaxID=765257 RepID=A0A0C9ZAW7_9AGAM|nr:tryptophan synthase beta subunit-like PLP-dependent enzyme [Pisolithus microcarpus]KIK26406.1 hypothetical protein PISMIDRAFT_676243 [Pisolithus microcarpus 441]
MNRPSKLYSAESLTKYANEDLNHTGSHKINNAVGQFLLAKRLGKTRIIAETGAGQHGVATATVCARFGMECVSYMSAEDARRQAGDKDVEQISELLPGTWADRLEWHI